MFSSYDNDEEVKDIDNDLVYSEMEDIKDRGVMITNKDDDININTNKTKTDTIDTIEKDLKNDATTEGEVNIYHEKEDVKDENRTTTSDYRQLRSQRDNDDRRRINSANRSFKKAYGTQSYSSSQQTCIYWLSGICRFGQGCHYLHSIPQSQPLQQQSLPYIPPPTLTSPTETTTLSSYEKVMNKEVEVTSDDQNKKKKKSTKSSTKVKDKDNHHDIIPPISSVSPKKKGKKKPATSKSDLEQLGSTPDSFTVELPKQSNEVDESKLCEEVDASLKFDVHLSDNINDNSSHEEIFLDLFQNSPKHFLQLLKLNDKTYISEELAARILNSRKRQPSFQSLQSVINEFQLRIKKVDFIARNKDVILAYYKQRQEVKKQLSLAIQEKESQSRDIDESLKSKIEDNVDYHEIENDDRYSTHQSSYDTHKQYSTSPSNASSYENVSGYPSTKEHEHDTNVSKDSQEQIYNPNDEVFYYTYVNPINGLQYIYPSSAQGSTGYPNMTADLLPVEYMNSYTYGYYPPMEFYPDIYSQAPVFSNPQQLVKARESTRISPSTTTSQSIQSSTSTQDDIISINPYSRGYSPAFDYQNYNYKNPRNTGNGGRGGRRGYGMTNYGSGRRESELRPYPNAPYPRGGGRRRYDQEQIPLGRGDARQQFHASTEAESTSFSPNQSKENDD